MICYNHGLCNCETSSLAFYQLSHIVCVCVCVCVCENVQSLALTVLQVFQGSEVDGDRSPNHPVAAHTGRVLRFEGPVGSAGSALARAPRVPPARLEGVRTAVAARVVAAGGERPAVALVQHVSGRCQPARHDYHQFMCTECLPGGARMGFLACLYRYHLEPTLEDACAFEINTRDRAACQKKIEGICDECARKDSGRGTRAVYHQSSGKPMLRS